MCSKLAKYSSLRLKFFMDDLFSEVVLYLNTGENII